MKKFQSVPSLSTAQLPSFALAPPATIIPASPLPAASVPTPIAQKSIFKLNTQQVPVLAAPISAPSAGFSFKLSAPASSKPMFKIEEKTPAPPVVSSVEEQRTSETKVTIVNPRKISDDERNAIIEKITDILLEVTGNNKKIVQELTDPEYQESWVNAFTHKSVDFDKNYEIYEKIGDTIMRTCFIKFLTEIKIRNERIMSELEHAYITKVFQADLSKRLGLGKIVVYDSDICDINIHIREDLIESLYGAIYIIGNKAYEKKNVLGIGMYICDRLTVYLFKNEIDMSKSEGMPQTRLKEIFDKIYVHTGVKEMFDRKKKGQKLVISFVPSEQLRDQVKKIFNVDLPASIGEAEGWSEKSLAPKISLQVLNYFKSVGITTVSAERASLEYIGPGIYDKLMEKIKSLGFKGFKFEILKRRDEDETRAASTISMMIIGIKDDYGNVSEIIMGAKGENSKDIKRRLITELISNP